MNTTREYEQIEASDKRELDFKELERPSDDWSVWHQVVNDQLIRTLGLNREFFEPPPKRDTGFGIFTVRTARNDGSEMHQPMLTFDDSAISFRTQKHRHDMWKKWIRENPI